MGEETINADDKSRKTQKLLEPQSRFGGKLLEI